MLMITICNLWPVCGDKQTILVNRTITGLLTFLFCVSVGIGIIFNRMIMVVQLYHGSTKEMPVLLTLNPEVESVFAIAKQCMLVGYAFHSFFVDAEFDCILRNRSFEVSE